MAMSRHHYAASYPYGVATDTRTGRRIATYYRFDSRDARDRWIADRPTDYAGNSGWRGSIAADDADMRAAIKYAEVRSPVSGDVLSTYWDDEGRGQDLGDYPEITDEMRREAYDAR